MSCLVCERIAQIQNNTNPYFVKKLDTGFVVLGDHQRFRGYTLFLCKEHNATELHHLERKFKLRFLEEMSLVAEAVHNAFTPEKLTVSCWATAAHTCTGISSLAARATPQPPARSGGCQKKRCIAIAPGQEHLNETN